jgi:hypothetical protein
VGGTLFEGIECQFNAGRNAQFFEHAKKVVLDGVFAELQSVGDFAIAQAFGNQKRHFFFAAAQD